MRESCGSGPRKRWIAERLSDVWIEERLSDVSMHQAGVVFDQHWPWKRSPHQQRRTLQLFGLFVPKPQIFRAVGDDQHEKLRSVGRFQPNLPQVQGGQDLA